MSIVVVAGALANKPHNGGEAWVRLSWLKGLRRIGCDVYFFEQIESAHCVNAHNQLCTFESSESANWFRQVMSWSGFTDQSSLICMDSDRSIGLDMDRANDIAKKADLLINISGHLTMERLFNQIKRHAYIDIDPGYTQFWHADAAIEFKLRNHDFYFTIGENIGSPECPIPTLGLTWRAIRQPVVLEDWPVTPALHADRFTTVASWRGGFGPVHFNGMNYGLKAHEFRKFIELPSTVSHELEIALQIHSQDAKDIAALQHNNWRLTDPHVVASSPGFFRRYVQESAGEFSVAQGVYAATQCGWFSDRTARYLASGKPVVVQDTGFGRRIPTGRGVIPFRTIHEAQEGLETVMNDYDTHCVAARHIAEQYFDSDKVLGRFLDEVGVSP